jgi:ABC-type Fe3+-siderophore transport system permease subunit
MLSLSTAFVGREFKQEVRSKSQATDFHITLNFLSNSGRVKFWLLIIVNMFHAVIIIIIFFFCFESYYILSTDFGLVKSVGHNLKISRYPFVGSC